MERLAQLMKGISMPSGTKQRHQPRHKKRSRPCNSCRQFHPGERCPRIIAETEREAQMTPEERLADIELRFGATFAAGYDKFRERLRLKPRPLADLDEREQQIPLFERD